MIETIVYDPTIVLVKTSILLQYVTVFVAHRRNSFHYLIHILIWVNVIFYICITFTYIFQVSRWKGDLIQHQQAADRGTVYAAPKAVDTRYPWTLQRQTRSRRLLRIHQRRVRHPDLHTTAPNTLATTDASPKEAKARLRVRVWTIRVRGKRGAAQLQRPIGPGPGERSLPIEDR